MQTYKHANYALHYYHLEQCFFVLFSEEGVDDLDEEEEDDEYEEDEDEDDEEADLRRDANRKKKKEKKKKGTPRVTIYDVSCFCQLLALWSLQCWQICSAI